MRRHLVEVYEAFLAIVHLLQVEYEKVTLTVADQEAVVDIERDLFDAFDEVRYRV